MNKQKLTGRFIVICSIALLTACSGSGSGDGGGSSGGGETLAPTLSPDSADYASKKVEISPAMDVDSINQLSNSLTDAFGLIGDLHLSVWGQPVDESVTYSCPEAGTAKVTVAGESGNFDESWEFSKCEVLTYNHGNVLLNGTYKYVDTLAGATATSETWQGYESYNITGEMKQTGQPLTIKGRADWDRLYSAGNETKADRVVETIEAFELKVGDRFVALDNVERRREVTESGETFTIKGKLIGSAVGGYLDISTPTPVLTTGNDVCPIEGIIKLVSDGTAEIRYGSSALGTADAVAIWIDSQIVESYADCSNISFAPVFGGPTARGTAPRHALL